MELQLSQLHNSKFLLHQGDDEKAIRCYLDGLLPTTLRPNARNNKLYKHFGAKMLTPMPIVVNEHVKTCAFIRRPAPHPAKEKSAKLPQVCWHLNMDSDLF